MAAVTAPDSLMSRTTSAFCNGDIRQQMTESQNPESSKNVSESCLSENVEDIVTPKDMENIFFHNSRQNDKVGIIQVNVFLIN